MKTITDIIKNNAPIVEFTTVCIVFVLPPLLYTPPVRIPEKPASLYAAVMMFLWVFAAAAYEEILYRLYLPERLSMLLKRYSLPVCKSNFCAELFAVLCFALAHRYLGAGAILFAAAAGGLFRLLYRRIQRSYGAVSAFCAVWLLHGCWNSGVYYYLMLFHEICSLNLCNMPAI